MATLSNSEEDAYYRNDSLKSVESQDRVFLEFGGGFGVLTSR